MLKLKIIIVGMLLNKHADTELIRGQGSEVTETIRLLFDEQL